MRRGLRKFLILLWIVTLLFPVRAFAAEGQTKRLHIYKLLTDEATLASWGTVDGYTGAENLESFKQLIPGRQVTPISGVYFVLATQKAPRKYVTNDPKEPLVSDMRDPRVIGGRTDGNGQLIMDVANVEPGNYTVIEDIERSKYVGPNGELITQASADMNVSLPMTKDGKVLDDVYVYPKNVQARPIVDKNFRDAISRFNELESTWQSDKGKRSFDIGDEVPYTVRTLIPAKAHYKTFQYQDVMTFGLKYQKDFKAWLVSGAGGKVLSKLALQPDQEFLIRQSDYGYEFELTDSGLALINEQIRPIGLEFEYSAKVTSRAMPDVEHENDVVLVYDNKAYAYPDNGSPTEVADTQALLNTGKVEAVVEWKGPDGQPAVPPAGINPEAYALIQMPDGSWSHLQNLIYENGAFTVKKENKTLWETEKYLKEKHPKIRFVSKLNQYTTSYSMENGKLKITYQLREAAPAPLDPTEPKVVVYGKLLTKRDAEHPEVTLDGAHFYVRNATKDKYLTVANPGTDAVNRVSFQEAMEAWLAEWMSYLKTNTVSPADSADTAAVSRLLQAQHAVTETLQMAGGYAWTENREEALVLVTRAGVAGVYGLKEGDYFFEERFAPPSYALSKDPFTAFRATAGSWHGAKAETKLADASDYDAYGPVRGVKVDNMKYRIPSTGGVGTVIFTVCGLCLTGTGYIGWKRRRLRLQSARWNEE